VLQCICSFFLRIAKVRRPIANIRRGGEIESKKRGKKKERELKVRFLLSKHGFIPTRSGKGWFFMRLNTQREVMPLECLGL
jgi:hypothetical protein